MCNECAICYEDSPKCRLICGHTFHHECIREWYMKGGNAQCPMCRNSICFRGITKLKNQWEEERRDQRFANVYREVIMSTIQDYKGFPRLMGDLLQFTLEEIEKDYTALKPCLTDPEDMRYFLENPMEVPVPYRGPPMYHEPTMKSKPPKKFKKQMMRNYHR